MALPRHVSLDGDALLLLDQRKLPGAIEWVRCRTSDEAATAIRDMIVRGAPAIGVAAAWGLALEAARLHTAGRMAELPAAAERLASARPTAVNLRWAVQRMLEAFAQDPSPVAMRAAADAIYEADLAACRTMGAFGASLVPDGARILTHCNAGALATAGHGTALGVIRSAVEQGKKVQVFADETRPWLQGARLTAWELQQDGIPVTVLPDVAAGHLMARGEIDLVIVGADRIAANGDTANKIGTYQVAVLAHAHGLPFYVAAPESTRDPATPDGSKIPIEERDPAEVLGFGGVRTAPQGVQARHPSFDVTPARYVTAWITEQGIWRRRGDGRLVREAR